MIQLVRMLGVAVPNLAARRLPVSSLQHLELSRIHDHLVGIPKQVTCWDIANVDAPQAVVMQGLLDFRRLENRHSLHTLPLLCNALSWTSTTRSRPANERQAKESLLVTIFVRCYEDTSSQPLQSASLPDVIHSPQLHTSVTQSGTLIAAKRHRHRCFPCRSRFLPSAVLRCEMTANIAIRTWCCADTQVAAGTISLEQM